LPIIGGLYFEYAYSSANTTNQISGALFGFVVFNVLFLTGILALALTFFYFLKCTEQIVGLLRWKNSRKTLLISRFFFVGLAVAITIVILVLLPENLEILKEAITSGENRVGIGADILDVLLSLNAFSFGFISLIVATIMLDLQDKIRFFGTYKSAYQLYLVASIVYVVELIRPLYLSILLYPLSCIFIRRKLSKISRNLRKK